MKLAAETREASTRTGKQLLASVRAFAEGDLLERYSRAVERGRSPGTHPVALGVVAGALGMAARSRRSSCSTRAWWPWSVRR